MGLNKTMINEQKPQNLFCTKHFLAVMAVFYMTTLNPAIDSWIDGNMTKKDIGKLFNALIVTIVGASLKVFDKDVYTPKFIPGRNKEEAVNNITTSIIQTIQGQTNQSIKEVTDAINSPTTLITNSNIVKDIQGSPLADILTFINNTTKTVEKEAEKVVEPTNKATNMIIRTEQETYFKTRPVDSNILSYNEKTKVPFGISTFISSYEADPSNKHVKFTSDNKTLYAFIPHVKLIKDGQEVGLLVPEDQGFVPTITQCNELYNTVLTDEEYKDFVNCLRTFNINTKLDVAHFMSQIGHESAGLRYSREIASGADYEYREDLGNIYEGDGVRFKG